MEYFITAVVTGIRQLIGGFGILFLLSFLMWLVSQRRRGEASGWLYYLVAPGVMFHELGHALGCVITSVGARVKISMNKIKMIVVAAVCCAMAGCDWFAEKDPPVALTFRNGVLSKQVMQVNNLSTAEGVEVYVYVANTESSTRSGNMVVPANSAKEVGALEIKWDFKAGDRGFVWPVRFGKKLFFELLPNNQYRTWFGHDDIPEVDVAAQVRARKIAEHEVWLKSTVEQVSMLGRRLFVAITQANTERIVAGLDTVWPKPQETIKDRAKGRLNNWKNKIMAKLGDEKETNTNAMAADIAEVKFWTSGEYFDYLFDVRSKGSEKHSPYLAGVDVDVVSSVEPKNGTLQQEAIRWSVLADIEDEMSDGLPILVSANFPCEKLRSFWDGKESAAELIPLSSSGVLKDEAFVIVYKSGQVKALPSSRATLSNIYGGAFNTYTNGFNRRLLYITPHGVVNTVGVMK